MAIHDSRSETLELVLASLSASRVPILFLGFFFEYSSQSANSLPSTSSMVWMLSLSALISFRAFASSSLFLELSSLGPSMMRFKR